MDTITVERHGATWIAHRLDEPDHDCAADDADTHHGTADHPTAALRALLKAEGTH